MSGQSNHGARYEAQTAGIAVTVMPLYRPERSSPDEGIYVWSYHVRIENQGTQEVWLRRRRWVITNAQGHQQIVEGAGVVGEEPHLPIGGVFEYASGTPLNTNSGFMQGQYEMETAEGQRFLIDIPLFPLDSPQAIPDQFH